RRRKEGLRGPPRSGRRLRRRRADARGGRHQEVRRLVRRPHGRHQVEAGRAGSRVVAVASQQQLVSRIWERDATLWTGDDEDRWLGWLDEPKRMQERIDELRRFADDARAEFTTFVLLGMGGSSLAPEVLKRSFGAGALH